MTRFRMPTTIHQGSGALQHLAELGAQRALVITDPFMAASAALGQVTDQLPGATITVFSEVQPDPTVSQVAKGVEAYLAADPDVVIALGGGSSIDTAKAVVHVAGEHGDRPAHGLVAIPTTSGSGSEVTSFAVITSEKPHRKVVLVSDDMAPAVAVLDPAMTRTLPASMTADTGMDALTHALEAYVSTAHNDFSDALAEKACFLVVRHLERAVRDGDDLEARERMHNASTMAAMAFENSGLGITHSLAHALGATFHKPHGRLNALLLPAVMEFNAGAVSYESLSPVGERYAHMSWVLGLEATTRRNLALALCTEVRRLRAAIGLPGSLQELGIGREDFLAALPALVETALADSCTPFNPVQPSAADLEAILRTVWSRA